MRELATRQVGPSLEPDHLVIDDDLNLVAVDQIELVSELDPGEDLDGALFIRACVFRVVRAKDKATASGD